MSQHTLYLAKNSAEATGNASLEDVARGMFARRFANIDSAASLATQATEILRRTLNFDISGAYLINKERPSCLSLIATAGLPDEFTVVARLIPLSDYDQVADIPYNDAHGSCYGDFFAPVVGAFGIRAWLVASLTDMETGSITGAVLLGSRNGKRFRDDETRLALSLAAVISERLTALRRCEADRDLSCSEIAA